MARASVFRTNRTQAVRLPKEVALPEGVSAVEVVAIGDARVLTPLGSVVDYWFDHGESVSADFLSDRTQGVQERTGL